MNPPDWFWQALATSLMTYGPIHAKLAWHAKQIKAINERIQNCPQKCAALVKVSQA